MKKTATRIKELKNFTGTAFLWKLSHPLERNTYVVTSATCAMFSGPETYIFAADRNGKIKSWGELEGSFKGELDHEQAIERAGYKVVKRKTR